MSDIITSGALEEIAIILLFLIPAIPIICGWKMRDKNLAILVGVIPTVAFSVLLQTMHIDAMGWVKAMENIPFFAILITIAAITGWVATQKKMPHHLVVAGILYVVWIAFFILAGIS